MHPARLSLPTVADRSETIDHLVTNDRPERWSRADKPRLERLPPGHPSSLRSDDPDTDELLVLRDPDLASPTEKTEEEPVHKGNLSEIGMNVPFRDPLIREGGEMVYFRYSVMSSAARAEPVRARKYPSKTGSIASFKDAWTTRSAMVAMPRRRFLPSALGIMRPRPSCGPSARTAAGPGTPRRPWPRCKSLLLRLLRGLRPGRGHQLTTSLPAGGLETRKGGGHERFPRSPRLDRIPPFSPDGYGERLADIQ
jgi:hypothetical protein